MDGGPDSTDAGDAGTQADGACAPQTFTVTGADANASFTVDGSPDPELTLCRGTTYTFEVNAIGHPFWIKTVSGDTGQDNTYDQGVTGAGTQNGTVTFTVPQAAPDTLYYQCEFHSGMTGTLNIQG